MKIMKGLLISLFLAGCGGGGGEAKSNKSQTTQPPPPVSSEKPQMELDKDKFDESVLG